MQGLFSGVPEELRPAEFFSAQKLLQCRAEMLNGNSTLPSFFCLPETQACLSDEQQMVMGMHRA
jgi:hypothetical protein